MSKGIAGYVAKTGETVNIVDAHKDKRFNPEQDILNKYRTKSILCMPILDVQKDVVVGVMQAINKGSIENVEFFTTDDEGLMSILSRLASVVFKNSLFNDSTNQVANELRQMVKVGL